MRSLLTQLSRILVGVLFIISGLIKLNDPVGFSFKLEEYFSEGVLNLPFLMPYALEIALFTVIFEVVLGVMLLIGYKRKFTIWSLLLMIVFFTFLTFYSAYFNKVTDCGCFGDALKLTPWQSFGKDVVLLVFILILYVNMAYIKPLFQDKINRGIAIASLIGCIFFGYYVLNHLPVKDFRAYKVGTNIEQARSIPDDAPKPIIDMLFIYSVNGELKEYTLNELSNLPEGAEFVERKDIVIQEGYMPSVKDFSMELDGEDYSQELLAKEKLVIFVMYDIQRASEEGLAKLAALAAQAQSNGYEVIAMTSSDQATIDATKAKYGHIFNYYFCDGTTLKTIERANPSIIRLTKGTIVQKAHWKDADKLSW